MRLAIPSLLVAVCLLLAACGDDDDSGATDATTDARTLSVEEYRGRMNRLCRESEAAKKKPEVFVASLSKLADFVEQSNKLARKLGLKDCLVDPILPDTKEPAAS